MCIKQNTKISASINAIRELDTRELEDVLVNMIYKRMVEGELEHIELLQLICDELEFRYVAETDECLQLPEHSSTAGK